MALQAFVPALPGPAGGPGLAALRGAAGAGPVPQAAQEPEQGAARLAGVAAVAAALAGLTQVRGSKNQRPARAQKTTRRAAAAAEEEAPPPPPPFDPAQQVGAMAPLGFFDPLGFSKVGDEAGFRKLREAELKHGRVAMMASAGLLVQSVAPFSFMEDVPRGIGAAYTGFGAIGFALIFAASGAAELVFWKQDPEKEVGDFGDPAGWGVFNRDPDPRRREEWVMGFRERELNNGRFAMFATVGILASEVLTGKTAFAQFGL
mmetsp:Transcript_53033/g.106455  ORF Transcript_53033/g.106455 Transcript_53033/m.106455 type:complete len:261 (-) Transcript_53033:193-975(-)